MSTPEVKKLRMATEHVSRELDKIISSMDSRPSSRRMQSASTDVSSEGLYSTQMSSQVIFPPALGSATSAVRVSLVLHWIMLRMIFYVFCVDCICR